jgi:hypothetical protein
MRSRYGDWIDEYWAGTLFGYRYGHPAKRDKPDWVD